MAKREYRGKVPIDQVSNYQLIASGREKELIVSKERALQLAQFKALKRQANQLRRRLNQPQREIIKDHVKNGGLKQPPENLQRYASERGVMMPELAVKLMLLLILISLLLPTLVACTNTVGTEQPVEPTPITEVVEIEPTEVVPQAPDGPAFAPTEEAESPANEENPVTEEVPVAEESPEAVGTPIPDSVVIDWIAQYAPSTPTPETFAEVPVISFDNNTSFVMAGGKAYVVTRVPDSNPIVEEFAADSYEQTEDGVNFFQGEGEARTKVAVLAKTTNGGTELTPTAVPAPTPTVPEDGIPTPPAEEEGTDVPPGGDIEAVCPFEVSEINDGLIQYPLVENDIGVVSFRIKVENILTEEINLGNGYSALISVEGWYLDANGKPQKVTVPIVIKGPNGEALIDGIFYEDYSWDEMDSQSLINTFRINYWLNHKDEYDDPSEWINGGDGNGVDFGYGDIISVPLPADYNSPIFDNPGYGEVANFGKTEREAMYTEESYLAYLQSGDPNDLELTESALETGIPTDFLWTFNIYNFLLVEDL